MGGAGFRQLGCHGDVHHYLAPVMMETTAETEDAHKNGTVL